MKKVPFFKVFSQTSVPLDIINERGLWPSMQATIGGDQGELDQSSNTAKINRKNNNTEVSIRLFFILIHSERSDEEKKKKAQFDQC